MRDLVLLQDDVIDAALLELIAHRKAGLAATDHDDAGMGGQGLVGNRGRSHGTLLFVILETM
jgi:hypothetical protein